LGIHRSTYRYRPKSPAQQRAQLEKAIVKLSQKHPTLGYKKITGKLRTAGYRVGKKRVQRVRREEGLPVPPPKKKTRRQGVSTGLPTKAERRNHVWAWDPASAGSDHTQRGGSLKVFNLIDEYTRECHAIHTARELKSADVLAVLQRAIAQHGAPTYIRSDNGPVPRNEVTTKQSAHSSRARSVNGWRRPRSARSTSTQVAPGRTGMSRASTVASAWSVSIGS